MANILNEIIAARRESIARQKIAIPEAEMSARARAASRPVISMSASIRRHAPIGVIAEFKRRSPSKGWIAPDGNPASTVSSYAEAGAAAASVLTEPDFFAGSTADLIAARAAAPSLPILRKDFIIDTYQIDEARAIGADAILLIASALAPAEVGHLSSYAHDLGLEVLLELHTPSELGHIAEGSADMIGINNRCLADFHTDIAVAESMIASLPEGVVRVAESGVSSEADVDRLLAAGFDALLIGEYLMRGNTLPRR